METKSLKTAKAPLKKSSWSVTTSISSKLRRFRRAVKCVVVTGLTRPLSSKGVEVLASVVLLILSLPILLYYNLRKAYVLVAAKQKFGKGATLVDGMDYVFSLDRFSKDPAAAITTVLKVDGELGLEALRHRVKANLTHKEWWGGSLVHMKLRTVYEQFMGYVVARKEEPFEVNRHVDHIRDTATGMRIFCRSESEISGLVDSVSAKPIVDLEEAPMSPWMIYLVHCKPPSPTNEARSKLLSTSPTPKVKASYLIIRSDHALFDGVSLVAILLNGLVDAKDGAEDAKLCLNSFKERSRLKRWWAEFCSIFLAFGNLLRHSLLDEQDRNPFVQARPRPVQAEDGRSEPQLRKKFTCTPTIIPLGALEEISRVTRVKINTIAIWAYLRALLHFCNKTAIGMSSSVSSANLASKSSASLHTLARRNSVLLDRDRRYWTLSLGQPVCMWMPGASVTLENRMAIIRRTFNGHELAGEGWDTLRRVQRNLEHPEIQSDVWAFYVAVKYFFGVLPVNTLEQIYKFVAPKVSVVSSNIRGSPYEQSILRNPIEWASMIVPIFDGVDVGLAVGSYNGNMTLAVAAAEGAVQCRDDVQELQDLMESEILNLHHSLTSTSIPEEDIQRFFAFPAKQQ